MAQAGPPCQAPAPSGVTEMERNILSFLAKNGPHKALGIAKGVGKTCASDVNKYLYTLKKAGLLDHDEKLWSVKQGDRKVTRPEVTEPSGTDMAQGSGDRTLSETQEEICLYLRKNGASAALDIAKGVNKKTAKQVNPDLYSLEKMGILYLDRKHWALTSNAGNGVRDVAPGNLTQHVTNYQINITQSPLIQIGNNNVLNNAEYIANPGRYCQNGAPHTKQPGAECTQNGRTPNKFIFRNSSMERCMFGDNNTMNISHNMDRSSGFDSEADMTHPQSLHDHHVEPQGPELDEAQQSRGRSDGHMSPVATPPPQTDILSGASYCPGSSANPVYISSPDNISIANSVVAKCQFGDGNSMDVVRELDSGIGFSGEGDQSFVTDLPDQQAQGNGPITREDLRLQETANGPPAGLCLKDDQPQAPQTSSPAISRRHLPSLDISDICTDLEKVALDEPRTLEE